MSKIERQFANRVVFKVPPPETQDRFSFATISDLRAFDGKDPQYEIRNQLTKLVDEGKAQFIILPGDISNQSGTSDQIYNS